MFEKDLHTISLIYLPWIVTLQMGHTITHTRRTTHTHTHTLILAGLNPSFHHIITPRVVSLMQDQTLDHDTKKEQRIVDVSHAAVAAVLQRRRRDEFKCWIQEYWAVKLPYQAYANTRTKFNQATIHSQTQKRVTNVLCISCIFFYQLNFLSL